MDWGTVFVSGVYRAWQIGVDGFLDNIKLALARLRCKVQKKSLIVLLQHDRSSWWHMRELNGKPAMQIVAGFYLKNITQEHAVSVAKTFLVIYDRKWWTPFNLRVEGNVFVKNHVAPGGAFGKHSIPSGFAFEGIVDWWIQPPIKNAGKPLRARACVVDQFGNEHWTDVLTWRYRTRN
jgi:hypothetical protein